MKKLSFQKIFCLLSVIFIGGCCIFYGTRFLRLYLANRKIEMQEKNSLVKVLKEDNMENEYFKSVNGENYFTGETDNNYLLYSNILWRIIKLNSDNSLTIITDKAISSLAYNKEVTFDESYIFNWLNKTDKEYSGILENNLSNKETYLQKTLSCNDTINELSNNPCQVTNTDNYFSLLPVVDYLNIGSKDSYLNNNEYFYLSNNNEEGKIWYVDDEGKATLGTGYEVLGVRPIATIKANVDYVSGKGTKEDPYTIEKENNLFGSYVKLGNDIWRIYEVNDKEVRLMLNDYLKTNDSNLSYIYSSSNSYHNDTASGSIAYYLNHDFLDSLSYKDIIKDTNWSNGFYNSTTEFDYTNSLKDTIDSKVALMSVGNIFLNPELYNYFTMTGAANRSSTVYIVNNNKKSTTKSVGNRLNVVPTITIDSTILTKGNGTIDSPLEME